MPRLGLFYSTTICLNTYLNTVCINKKTSLILVNWVLNMYNLRALVLFIIADLYEGFEFTLFRKRSVNMSARAFVGSSSPSVVDSSGPSRSIIAYNAGSLDVDSSVAKRWTEAISTFERSSVSLENAPHKSVRSRPPNKTMMQAQGIASSRRHSLCWEQNRIRDARKECSRSENCWLFPRPGWCISISSFERSATSCPLPIFTVRKFTERYLLLDTRQSHILYRLELIENAQLTRTLNNLFILFIVLLILSTVCSERCLSWPTFSLWF